MIRTGAARTLRWAIAAILGFASARADAPPAGSITFRVDAARRQPISRLVYGLNFREGTEYGANDTSFTTLNRYGGNRLTAYNWETNESNCGSDCGKGFSNDWWLAHELRDKGEPGGAVAHQIDATFRHGKAGVIVTVPIAGWVAADHAGDTAPLTVAASVEAPAAPGARFRASLPRNPRGATARPDLRDGAVYQDDFIRWLGTRYPRADPDRPILASLDNEPDLWGSTHAEIRGRTASGGEVLTGFDELVSRTVDYASAIKQAAPGMTILAPGLSGWFGFLTLGHKTPPPGYAWYVDYFLERVRAASVAKGRTLVDVLDVHWYPEARNTCGSGEKPCWSERITNDWQPQTPSVIEARVQAPRSLWDPTYVEDSWVSKKVPGCGPLWGGCPIRLLPRLKESIAAHAPGTKIAVTEYYYGRGGDISGAIAQADVLGIFGREGVYAATFWPNAAIYAWNKPEGACGAEPWCQTLAYRCILAAFKAYLAFDGKGGRFGDESLAATTTDPVRTSVYASADPATPGRIVVVALNKTDAPLEVALEVSNARRLTSAQAFRVSGGIGSCNGPARAEQVPVTPEGAARLTLPPLSITTYALVP